MRFQADKTNPTPACQLASPTGHSTAPSPVPIAHALAGSENPILEIRNERFWTSANKTPSKPSSLHSTASQYCHSWMLVLGLVAAPKFPNPFFFFFKFGFGNFDFQKLRKPSQAYQTFVILQTKPNSHLASLCFCYTRSFFIVSFQHKIYGILGMSV